MKFGLNGKNLCESFATDFYIHLSVVEIDLRNFSGVE